MIIWRSDCPIQREQDRLTRKLDRTSRLLRQPQKGYSNRNTGLCDHFPTSTLPYSQTRWLFAAESHIGENLDYKEVGKPV